MWLCGYGMLWYRVASGRDSEVTCQQACSCWCQCTSMYTCRVEWVFRNDSNGSDIFNFCCMSFVSCQSAILHKCTWIELDWICILHNCVPRSMPAIAETTRVSGSCCNKRHLLSVQCTKPSYACARKPKGSVTFGTPCTLELAGTCHSCFLSTRSTYLNMIFQVWKCCLELVALEPETYERQTCRPLDKV